MEREIIMKMSNLIKAIDITVQSGSVPMVMGHSGIGKSSIAKIYADLIQERENKDVVYVELFGSVLKEGELTGMPINVTKNYSGEELNVTTYTIHTAIRKLWEANEAGKIPLLFLDELNRSDIAVQQELMQLILTKQINGNPLPENTIMIAAGNPDSEDDDGIDYQVNTMNYALRDRFTDLHLEVDSDEWIKWALQQVSFYDNDDNLIKTDSMIHKNIIEFITNDPLQLHIINAENEGKNPTPRAWERTSDAYRYFEENYDMEDSDNKRAFWGVVEGNLGKNTAIAFRSFIEENSKPMINPKTIINNKDLSKDTKLIEKIKNETMARQNLLTRYVYIHIGNNIDKFKEKELNNFITYLDIIPEELLMMAISEIKRNPNDNISSIFEILKTNQTFIQKFVNIIQNLK